jgi:hypothetical protein
MKENGTSQNYQKGNLKAMIHFAQHTGPTLVKNRVKPTAC